MSLDKEATFPLDWNEWREMWREWYHSAGHDILRPSSYKFPDKNFLADEVLGVWHCNGRNVELSEVTFPNFSERGADGRLIRTDVRGIGITYADASGRYVPSDLDASRPNIVHTFAELEEEMTK